MSKPRVVVTRRWPEEVEAQLTEHFDVQLNPEDRPLDRDALKDAFVSADAVFSTVTDPIDADVFSTDPLRARLIGNFGVGFNNIDIEAAKARGVTVTNTPEVLTDATADLAMTLLLSVARRIGERGRHHRRKGAVIDLAGAGCGGGFGDQIKGWIRPQPDGGARRRQSRQPGLCA